MLQAQICTKFCIVDKTTAVTSVIRKSVTYYKDKFKSKASNDEPTTTETNSTRKVLRLNWHYAGPVIYLELVTSKACIATIRKFIARRDIRWTLLSNNSNNFLETDKLLQKADKVLKAHKQRLLKAT